MAKIPQGPAKTSPAIEVDSLVYSFVKEKNPGLLMQMFSKERCRELEKTDHLFDQTSLLSMLRAYRTTHPKSTSSNDRVEKLSAEKKARTMPVYRNDRIEDDAAEKRANQEFDISRHVKPTERKGNLYSQDMMHRRFCHIDDPQTSVDLTIYNQIRLNSDRNALEMLFGEETREKFDTMVCRIDVPSVLRLVAYRRKEKEKSKAENKGHLPISTCQFCRKNIKGVRSFLLTHIGQHEDIPQYCFIEGCDKYMKSVSAFTKHLQVKHLLYANDFTASEYHKVQSMTNAYYKHAGWFLDKYFPPESFVSFSDRRTRNINELEDDKCLVCGEIVKVTTTRRRHVTMHLNLSYECVIEGCHDATDPISFSMHLKSRHAKKVGQLNAQELHQHRQNRIDYNKVMKIELPKYFPRKSNADKV